MNKAVRIAFASGKGGVGKTTLATSLSVSLAEGQIPCVYYDCDVEAPNGHLFLKPDFSQKKTVTVPMAAVSPDLCSACGTCVAVCQYHALVLIKDCIHVFEQLCHGCGSCIRMCPQGALSEQAHEIGSLKMGSGRANIFCIQGTLKISEPMASPLIRDLKNTTHTKNSAVYIYDAPPGASCSAVETLRGSDFVYLVTEPTPFGLHDLKQILGVVKAMNIAHAVIINRDGIGDQTLDTFLTNEKIPVALRIPYDAHIAAVVAGGGTLVDADPHYGVLLREMVRERI